MSVLFISYSHRDEKLKDRLLQHLRVLEPEGLVEIWIDDWISSGAEWEMAINDALLQADIAILLITSNFLTSKFILENEVPALLKRRQAGTMSLFPIIGMPCAWQEVTWLAKLNVRPKNGEPIWGKDNKTTERYLADITREIANMIKMTSGTDLNANSAINSLEKDFHRSLSSPNPLKPTEISTMLSNAISHGTPLYNNGDLKGCFEIYHHTARRLLTQLLLKAEEMKLLGMKIDGMEYFREDEGLLGPMSLPLTNKTQKKRIGSTPFSSNNC